MARKNRVTNTTAEAHRDPFGTFAVRGGIPGIEAQEAKAQSEFEESETLPSELRGHGTKEDAHKLLESWGFVFGKHLGGDTLFRQGKLPLGWKKVGTGHSMWTDIVDADGRQRCSVFYKGAFYDRDAFLNITPRYLTDIEYENKELRTKGPSRGIVKDGEKVIFTGPWNTDPPGGRGYEAYNKSGTDAATWLRENLPKDVAEQWGK